MGMMFRPAALLLLVRLPTDTGRPDRTRPGGTLRPNLGLDNIHVFVVLEHHADAWFLVEHSDTSVSHREDVGDDIIGKIVGR